MKANMAKKKKSLHSAQIKSFNNLLKDIELRHRVTALIIKAFGGDSPKKITSDQVVKIRISKSEEDLLPLTNKLDFTETDWKSDDGRYAVTKFYGEAIEPLITAMHGGSSIIQKKALEQISIIVRDLLTTHQLYELLTSINVPESLLFIPDVDSKDEATYREELIFNVMTALSSTGSASDRALFFNILEEIAHPLTFQGDEQYSIDFQRKITKIIRSDGFSLLGGKIHVFTEEDAAQIDVTKKTADVNNYNADGEKASLKGQDISFDDDSARLIIGKQAIQLPPYKNEHCFCRAAFRIPKSEVADWSILYEEMSGSKPNDLGGKIQKRAVYDTMLRINKRISKAFNTDDDLFVFQERTIRRAF